MILVSHDRHLLDACADRLWLVRRRQGDVVRRRPQRLPPARAVRPRRQWRQGPRRAHGKAAAQFRPTQEQRREACPRQAAAPARRACRGRGDPAEPRDRKARCGAGRRRTVLTRAGESRGDGQDARRQCPRTRQGRRGLACRRRSTRGREPASGYNVVPDLRYCATWSGACGPSIRNINEVGARAMLRTVSLLTAIACAWRECGTGGDLSGSSGARRRRLRRRQRAGHSGPHGLAGARQQPRPAVLRREPARRERHDRRAVGRAVQARRLFAAVLQLVDHLRRPTSTRTSATTRSPTCGRSPPSVSSTACSCWSTRNRRSRRWRSSSPSRRPSACCTARPASATACIWRPRFSPRRPASRCSTSPTRARRRS